YFVFFTIQDKKIINTEIVQNSGANQGAGAGIKASEQLGEAGADILIAETIGPKAVNILEQLNIKIVKKSGIVKAVVEEYIRK
ncbi:hypothetical protein KAJ61_02745, partial [Candidatus Parcubacteria bacterium]|nr:hypothetical protein [Candidatus Parcubacteria bacterium]